MEELKQIEQHPCDREGCTSTATNHYHCGRCLSPAVTSMMGHFVRGRGPSGRNTYTCKPEDLPTEVEEKPSARDDYLDVEIDEASMRRRAARYKDQPAKLLQIRAGQLNRIFEKYDYPLVVGVTRQVVSTVEELEALPVHAVIVGIGDKWQNEHSDRIPTVFQRQGMWDAAWWKSPDYVEPFTSAQLMNAKFLPALYVVVWTPAMKRCNVVLYAGADGRCQKAVHGEGTRCSMHGGLG